MCRQYQQQPILYYFSYHQFLLSGDVLNSRALEAFLHRRAGQLNLPFRMFAIIRWEWIPSIDTGKLLTA